MQVTAFGLAALEGADEKAPPEAVSFRVGKLRYFLFQLPGQRGQRAHMAPATLSQVDAVIAPQADKVDLHFLGRPKLADFAMTLLIAPTVVLRLAPTPSGPLP